MIAQGLLGVLAAFSLLHSALPRPIAWPAAGAALAYGLWLARRERRRPARLWVFAGPEVPVRVNDEAVSDVHIEWRGPLAFMRWRAADGRWQRAVWWPDTLPPARRRELRLAVPRPETSRPRSVMAP